MKVDPNTHVARRLHAANCEFEEDATRCYRAPNWMYAIYVHDCARMNEEVLQELKAIDPRVTFDRQQMLLYVPEDTLHASDKIYGFTHGELVLFTFAALFVALTLSTFVA